MCFEKPFGIHKACNLMSLTNLKKLSKAKTVL